MAGNGTSFCWNEVGALNEVQINLAQSDAKKPPPFHLRRVFFPFSHAYKTNRTCLLVSGQFQGSVVFPSGACFSRLEDDVCHCMYLYAALTDYIWREHARPVSESLLLFSWLASCSSRCPWKPAYLLGVSKYRMLCLATKQDQLHLLVSKHWEYTYCVCAVSLTRSWDRTEERRTKHRPNPSAAA